MMIGYAVDNLKIPKLSTHFVGEYRYECHQKVLVTKLSQILVSSCFSITAIHWHPPMHKRSYVAEVEDCLSLQSEPAQILLFKYFYSAQTLLCSRSRGLPLITK
jgi:hypothetical protein